MVSIYLQKICQLLLKAIMMSGSGRAVMRMRILEGRSKVPLASVSRRALHDGPSALSSRASTTTRIGPTVVSAFAGSRINLWNCSVAETVVQREQFPLTILVAEGRCYARQNESPCSYQYPKPPSSLTPKLIMHYIYIILYKNYSIFDWVMTK